MYPYSTKNKKIGQYHKNIIKINIQINNIMTMTRDNIRKRLKSMLISVYFINIFAVLSKLFAKITFILVIFKVINIFNYNR